MTQHSTQTKPCVHAQFSKLIGLAKGNMKTHGRPRRLGNGIVEYPKRGYEPPPDMDGYTRDPGNAWRFLPQWQPCNRRLQMMKMKSCGAMEVLTICGHKESPHCQKSVVFKVCEACELRLQGNTGISGSSNETETADTTGSAK